MSSKSVLLDRQEASEEALKRFRPPKSTYILGSVVLFVVIAGFLSGPHIGLIWMAFFGAATGLYVAATGRRSWALIPGGRRMGLIVVAASVVLAILTAATAPRSVPTDLDATAASEVEKRNAEAARAGASASAQASATATPSPSATPSDNAAPLDPDTTPALTAGVDYKAPKSQPAYATKAMDLLATLPIKGRAPKTGYDRAAFGQAWADVDRNGCDTRNDILKRDLTAITFTNSVPCKVQTGVLADPYTGKSINFLRGTSTSTAVQIDHVVALSDAWQKGAQQLNVQQRTAFANDPLNLQAADGPANMQKGDGDAATWLPPNKGYRCEYVARQISVKATYSLWVTQAEHDAMKRILGDCSGQLAPTSEQAPPPPAPAPAPAPAPVAPVPAAPAPAPAPAPVAPVPAPAPAPVAPAPVPVAPAAAYYANCAAVRAAGNAPLLSWQPGYSRKLDRDGDGIACER